MTVNSNDIIMWTAQTQTVCDSMERDDVAYVRKEYILQKYGETAWSFQLAYGFFVKKMEKCVMKPEEAQSPIWLFKDPKWIGASLGTELLKVRIPAGQMLFFHRRRWEQILNLSYVGNEKEREDFEKQMFEQGISDISEIFMKPYYPGMKNKIMKSWDKVFETNGMSDQEVQGAVWCLRKEWIV